MCVNRYMRLNAMGLAALALLGLLMAGCDPFKKSKSATASNGASAGSGATPPPPAEPSPPAPSVLGCGSWKLLQPEVNLKGPTPRIVWIDPERATASKLKMGGAVRVQAGGRDVTLLQADVVSGMRAFAPSAELAYRVYDLGPDGDDRDATEVAVVRGEGFFRSHENPDVRAVPIPLFVVSSPATKTAMLNQMAAGSDECQVSTMPLPTGWLTLLHSNTRLVAIHTSITEIPGVCVVLLVQFSNIYGLELPDRNLDFKVTVAGQQLSPLPTERVQSVVDGARTLKGRLSAKLAPTLGKTLLSGGTAIADTLLKRSPHPLARAASFALPMIESITGGAAPNEVELAWSPSGVAREFWLNTLDDPQSRRPPLGTGTYLSGLRLFQPPAAPLEQSACMVTLRASAADVVELMYRGALATVETPGSSVASVSVSGP